MSFLERLGQSGPLFNNPLFEISGTRVTLASLITFVVVLIATYVAAGLLRRAVERAFAVKGLLDQGTSAVASRLVRYLVLLIGWGVAIHGLGIDLTALFAAGAVLAVAIGFAMQNISQNFVSGVILLLERAIKPGDVIEVEGRLVKVRDMGIRATVGRTLDEEDIIIPNSQLVSSTVKNYTLKDSIYRLRTLVGVVYSSDLKRVREVLEETAQGLDWRSPAQAPRILLKQFADSSVNWEVSVWIEDPWRMQTLRNRLNEAVWWALKDAGVVIAFPQLDVHFDPPVVESLAGLRSEAGAAR